MGFFPLRQRIVSESILASADGSGVIGCYVQANFQAGHYQAFDAAN